MHKEAYDFVAAAIQGQDLAGSRVLEIGSRVVNGSVRPLFAGCREYVGIDPRPGPGVDVVVHAQDYTGTGFDLVVCCEVLEHDPDPAGIVRVAGRALVPGGLLVLTAAGPGRPAHNCDGGPALGSEHYANIYPAELDAWLDTAGFEQILTECNIGPADVYAMALKGKAV